MMRCLTIVLCSLTAWSPLRGDDLVAEIVAQWKRDAAAVESLHMVFTGHRYQAEGTNAFPGMPAENSRESVTPRRLELWLEPRADRERIRFEMVMGTMEGPTPTTYTIARRDDITRELNPGDSDRYPYDQFGINRGPRRHDYELLPTRVLLNHAYFEEGPLFDHLSLKVRQDAAESVESAPCLLLEAVADGGVRIWCEDQRPYRIRRLEFNHLTAARTGHFEVVLSYLEKPHASGLPIAELSRIRKSMFLPGGTLREFIESHVELCRVNEPMDERLFVLDPPPGAIITDDTVSPFRMFVQQADGTQLEFTPGDGGSAKCFERSAAVPGSRVFGQPLPQLLRDLNEQGLSPPAAERVSDEPLDDDALWGLSFRQRIILLNIAVMIPIVWYYLRCRRHDRLHPPPEAKP